MTASMGAISTSLFRTNGWRTASMPIKSATTPISSQRINGAIQAPTLRSARRASVDAFRTVLAAPTRGTGLMISSRIAATVCGSSVLRGSSQK